MYIWIWVPFFGKHLLLWFHHSVDIHHAASGRGQTSKTSAASPPSHTDFLVQSYPKPLLHKCAFFWHSVHVPSTYLEQHVLKLPRKENFGDRVHWLLSLLLLLVMRSSWCSGWPGCTQILLTDCLISLVIDQISSRVNVLIRYTGISEPLPSREEGFRKIHRNYVAGKVISGLQTLVWV